jgi:hypothetical protein
MAKTRRGHKPLSIEVKFWPGGDQPHAAPVALELEDVAVPTEAVDMAVIDFPDCINSGRRSLTVPEDAPNVAKAQSPAQETVTLAFSWPEIPGMIFAKDELPQDAYRSRRRGDVKYIGFLEHNVSKAWEIDVRPHWGRSQMIGVWLPGLRCVTRLP